MTIASNPSPVFDKPVTLTSRRRSAVLEWVMRYNFVFIFLFAVVVATFLSDDFLTFGNIANLFQQGAIVGIIAIGMTFAAMTVVPFGVAGAGMSLLDPRILALGLVVALVSSALPYTLDMVALRHIPKRTFGVAVSGDPAIGALAGLFVLGEHLTTQQWLAIGAIIAASVGAVLTSPSDEQPLQDPAAPA